MGDCGDDDFEWQPPSEAEMKVIQARRERSDKISKIMGQYLLKGHRMLDSLCPVCSCILLQLNPTKKLHCVSCIDLDSEAKKDDPALNSAAASSTVTEEQHRKQTSSASSLGISTQQSSLPGTSNLNTRDESVEEHATPSVSRTDLENLSRSQLTAVHDIPAAVLTSSQSNMTGNCVISTSTISTNIGTENGNIVPSSTNQRRRGFDPGNSKLALEQTIATLTRQIEETTENLAVFDSNRRPLSYGSAFFETLEALEKLTRTLSTATQAYKQLDEFV